MIYFHSAGICSDKVLSCFVVAECLPPGTVLVMVLPRVRFRPNRKVLVTQDKWKRSKFVIGSERYAAATAHLPHGPSTVLDFSKWPDTLIDDLVRPIATDENIACNLGQPQLAAKALRDKATSSKQMNSKQEKTKSNKHTKQKTKKDRRALTDWFRALSAGSSSTQTFRASNVQRSA